MGKTTDESHEFQVSIEWTGGHEGETTFVEKPSLSFSSPPIWGGLADRHSPQELFVASISSCYVTTFGEFIQRMGEPVQALNIHGRGVVKRHPDGGWHFTDIYVTMHVTISEKKASPKIQRAVELAHKYCMVSRSITCKIHLESQVIVSNKTLE